MREYRIFLCGGDMRPGPRDTDCPDPLHDPYGVLPEADQEPVVVRVCETVGELIRDNFLHLLDRGELGTLRRLLEEAAEDYDDLRLPEVPHV